MRYRDGDDFCVVLLAVMNRPIYIGRHYDCAVCIRHDPRVSRRHARLIYGGGVWSIEDAAARNGTRIDGDAIAGEVVLLDCAVIGVGRTTLSYHARHATPPVQPCRIGPWRAGSSPLPPSGAY